MDIKEIKKKLNTEEYSFLKDEPKLNDNIMLLTLGGSIAYGTNIETSEYISDIDLRGVRLNSKEELLTMNCDDKPYEERNLDVVIYPLKQMITLLSKCNPNVIELLGTKDEHILKLSKEGKLIRDNVDLFLTKQAQFSFAGYATAQLRRLENALARGEYPQAKKEEHILKSLNTKMSTFKERFNSYDENINIYLGESNKTGFDKEIIMDLSLNKFPVRDFKTMYEEMASIIKDFDKLNHRNSKKDEIHLLKHAMHLIRIFKMGIEILEGKGVNTYREHDRDFLLDIRNGKYTYDEIFGIVNNLEKDFEYAIQNTSLPDRVDSKKIKDLTMEINKEILLKKEY